ANSAVDWLVKLKIGRPRVATKQCSVWPRRILPVPGDSFTQVKIVLNWKPQLAKQSKASRKKALVIQRNMTESSAASDAMGSARISPTGIEGYSQSLERYSQGGSRT